MFRFDDFSFFFQTNDSMTSMGISNNNNKINKQANFFFFIKNLYFSSFVILSRTVINITRFWKKVQTTIELDIQLPTMIMKKIDNTQWWWWSMCVCVYSQNIDDDNKLTFFFFFLKFCSFRLLFVIYLSIIIIQFKNLIVIWPSLMKKIEFFSLHCCAAV